VVSRPGIILRYTREGGGGPLEGEMEHEAREARPIGAQGAFVSNSMHYIYTPAPFAAPSIPGYTHRLANRVTLPARPAKCASIRSLLCSISSIALRFDPSESDPRNLSRRTTEKVTLSKLEGAINQNCDDSRREVH